MGRWQNRDSLPTTFIGRWQRILCRVPLLAGDKAAMVDEILALSPVFHVAGGKAGISKILVCFFCFASHQSNHKYDYITGIHIYHTDLHIYHINPHI
jgi:hypothetical protein